MTNEEIETLCDTIESLEISVSSVALILKIIRKDLLKLLDNKED